MQEDMILGSCWIVLSKSSTPVVADGICIYGAIAIECSTGDWCITLLHGFQSLFAVLVPEVESTI